MFRHQVIRIVLDTNGGDWKIDTSAADVELPHQDDRELESWKDDSVPAEDPIVAGTIWFQTDS